VAFEQQRPRRAICDRACGDESFVRNLLDADVGMEADELAILWLRLHGVRSSVAG
jgi:hypothetical protein